MKIIKQKTKTLKTRDNGRSSDAVSPNFVEVWKDIPSFQGVLQEESKDSEYAADNIRYKYQLKSLMVIDFIQLYTKYFDAKNIRYIF